MALSPPCALIGGPVRRSLVHCDQIADGPLTSARIGAAVGHRMASPFTSARQCLQAMTIVQTGSG